MDFGGEGSLGWFEVSRPEFFREGVYSNDVFAKLM